MEHKPIVDEWFRMMGTFKHSDGDKYLTLRSGRVTLYFMKQSDGSLKYDGWGTYVGDMGLTVEES